MTETNFIEVYGTNRESIPKENETIEEILKINDVLPLITDVVIYLRIPEQCPYNRGNWVIDLGFKNGEIFAIKLPKEMTEEQVVKYAKPLIDKLNEEEQKLLN